VGSESRSFVFNEIVGSSFNFAIGSVIFSRDLRDSRRAEPARQGRFGPGKDSPQQPLRFAEIDWTVILPLLMVKFIYHKLRRISSGRPGQRSPEVI
jgi:hypothetical protein